MPLSIYQLSIPTFLRGLAIAGEYCRKASAFCSERGISPSTLIDARLAPDMLPFAGQIQRISDTSKRPTARLAEDVSWAIDNLVNRAPPPTGITKDYVDTWQRDFEDWCSRVSARLGNRAFLTRADQLHFDYLGFIETIVQHAGVARLNELLSQLKL